jgi:hypothetical protein
LSQDPWVRSCDFDDVCEQKIDFTAVGGGFRIAQDEDVFLVATSKPNPIDAASS